LTFGYLQLQPAAAVAVCGLQELQKLGAADALMLKTKDALKIFEVGAGEGNRSLV
jgi:hypothetical protein